MNQSRGITDLLAAEKKAQDIIDEARRRKAKRIKDAQNEAKTDVDKFKGEREQSYKSIEQQQLGDRDQMMAASSKDTEVQIDSLKTQYSSNKDELLERIMSLVCDIKPESHINARIE